MKTARQNKFKPEARIRSTMSYSEKDFDKMDRIRRKTRITSNKIMSLLIQQTSAKQIIELLKIK